MYLPHTRGGEPQGAAGTYDLYSIFPTPVGVNRSPASAVALETHIFPTPVGVNRDSVLRNLKKLGHLPHTRGGEPR